MQSSVNKSMASVSGPQLSPIITNQITTPNSTKCYPKNENFHHLVQTPTLHSLLANKSEEQTTPRILKKSPNKRANKKKQTPITASNEGEDKKKGESDGEREKAISGSRFSQDGQGITVKSPKPCRQRPARTFSLI